MKVITLSAHKGGVGKTTISILLAKMLINDKKKVVLIDLDPQKSLSEWWQQRADDDPIDLLSLDDVAQLEQAKQAFKDKKDFMIIDTPPAHQDYIKPAIDIADLVIIPCGASPLDIRGVGETISIIERLKKPFFFVINRVDPKTIIAKETISTLAQYGKIAPYALVSRVDYSQSLIAGNTPLDSGNSKLKQEVKTLYDYLIKQIGML